MAVLEDKDFFIVQGSGAFVHCKWCHGHGCLCCRDEYEKYITDRMKPIFTARLDNQKELEALNRVIGADAMEADYDAGGFNGVVDGVAVRALIENIKRIGSSDETE
jgi:hypothetical protein